MKIYAAYHAASRHEGQPTVILAQTKKGYGMGLWGQGKMGTHQQKKLDDEALRAFRDRFVLPLSDEDVSELRFYHPGRESPEIRYLRGEAQGARRLPAGAQATAGAEADTFQQLNAPVDGTSPPPWRSCSCSRSC